MAFTDPLFVWRDGHPGQPNAFATTVPLPCPDFGLHIHPESEHIDGHADTEVGVAVEIGGRVVAGGLSIRSDWRDLFEHAHVIETGMLITLLENGIETEYVIDVFP